MLKQFLNHIENTYRIQPSQTVLLAVSGGIDSMVMLDLFRKSNIEFAVAHCNFQLRGEASDGDEDFVKDYCEEHQVPVHVNKFSTEGFAKEKGISIQMAARDLRYRWFEKLLNENQYDWLATAHHLNDNLETVLLNFVRGTGLDGLVGIPHQNKKIIRPLLPFSKTDIESYAKDHLLEWREDASNQTIDYDRNFIRHKIVPLLKQLNPSLEHGFHATHERLAGAQELVAEQILQLKKQLVVTELDITKIGIPEIMTSGFPATVLWYLIREFGFTFDQCRQITEPHETGKSFYTDTTRLTVDRGSYVLSHLHPGFNGKVVIEKGQTNIRLGEWELSITESGIPDKIETDPQVGLFDLDSLKYPLIWRNWAPGDHFIPLGMQQHKKVSDFLIDQKVALPEKENVTVLESDGKICWVAGHRISEAFKIKSSTKRVIIIRKIR